VFDEAILDPTVEVTVGDEDDWLPVPGHHRAGFYSHEGAAHGSARGFESRRARQF
jgi:hypothetical protein